MKWLREDAQWLLTGLLAGAGCLSVCLVTVAAAVFIFGFNIVPAALVAPAPATPPAVVSVTPSPPHPVTPSPASPANPSPAATISSTAVANLPPAGLIVYTCFEGGFDHICAIDAASGSTGAGNDSGAVNSIRRLTNAPATDFYPELGPRGELITFSSNRSGEFRIYLMDRDGGNVRQVSPDSGSHFAPDISPDGTQIVYTNAYRGANTARTYQNIWIMNIDGSNPRPLTTGPHNDVDPAWSPDGTQIAFSSDRGWRPAHWIMDATGENMRMLPDEVSEHGGRSDWSPDGRWLAFYAGPRDSRDVYLVTTDGSGQSRRLTFSGRNLAPAYSPDGQWLVFTSYREEDNANLFIMRPDGSDVRQLTFEERADWQPRWGE